MVKHYDIVANDRQWFKDWLNIQESEQYCVCSISFNVYWIQLSGSSYVSPENDLLLASTKAASPCFDPQALVGSCLDQTVHWLVDSSWRSLSHDSESSASGGWSYDDDGSLYGWDGLAWQLTVIPYSDPLTGTQPLTIRYIYTRPWH